MSARGTATDVPVTRPIVRTLPAIYQESVFLDRFTAGLDAVLAPAYATLDCLHAYVDPAVAPPDFVGWLGGWVGAQLDEDWPLDRRRAFVALAARIYARRGTAGGLADEIELYTGGRVTVDDPGAVWTSRLPTGNAERRARRRDDRTVRVTVDAPDAASVNWPALQATVRDAVPAHLPVEVELRETAAALPAPAGTSDAGTSDAGTSDAGTSDAGTSDAGTSDAAMSDAGTSGEGETS